MYIYIYISIYICIKIYNFGSSVLDRASRHLVAFVWGLCVRFRTPSAASSVPLRLWKAVCSLFHTGILTFIILTFGVQGPQGENYGLLQNPAVLDSCCPVALTALVDSGLCKNLRHIGLVARTFRLHLVDWLITSV